jgi:hypothetical protein
MNVYNQFHSDVRRPAVICGPDATLFKGLAACHGLVRRRDG